MTGGLRIGRFFGFEVRLDASWFVVFFLVLWIFSGTVFPRDYPELSNGEYILMGLAGAILFFVSVLLHELAHSAVARTRGIEVEGITLFIFGGMARTRSEPETPKDEFLLTAAGPLMSAAIGFFLLWFASVGRSFGLHVAITGVADYLALLNFVLAVFNLIPGLPLDGGRLFRALVWHLTGDIRKATRWASLTGRAFGFVLIGLGVLQLFNRFFIGGIWFVFIGWFLAQAAEASYQQLIMRRILEGVRAREAMTQDPETVSPRLSLRELVDEYFLQRRYNAFPVVAESGELLGLVTLGQVKQVKRDEWHGTGVSDVMMPLDGAAVVKPDDSLAEALSRMQRADIGRALVVDYGLLEGVITRSDVSRWLERYQQLR